MTQTVGAGDHVGMKPYSEDLTTRRIVKALQEGISKSGAARLFGVSLSSIKRYVKIAEGGSSLESPERGVEGRPRDRPHHREAARRGRTYSPGGNPLLRRRRFLEHATGKILSVSTVGRLLKRLGFGQKNGAGGGGGTGRRMAESRLEGDGRPRNRPQGGLLFFVEEMGADISLGPALRSLQERREGLLLNAPLPRQEHHCACQHGRGGHGGPSL